MFENFENFNLQQFTPVLYVGIFILVIGLLSVLLTYKGTTMPLGTYPKLTLSEGFYGGAANGAGEPSCLRTLSDAAAVYDVVAGQPGAIGTQDLAEFKLLLSKWACLKKDLMSPSGIVDATRMLPFSTLHDRIPVPDLTGQCNAKSVPLRDLDITFDTWKERGLFLLRRLSTAAGIGGAELEALQAKLMAAWSDVYNIAGSQCLTYIPSGQKMLPRDAAPYCPDEIADLGTYKGYF